MSTIGVIGKLVRLMARSSLDAPGDAAYAIAIELAGVALGVAAPVLLKLTVDALSTEAPPGGLVFFYIAGFVGAWSGTSATAALKLVFTMRIIDKLGRRLTLDVARSQLPALARRREGDSAQLQGVLERLPFSLQIVIDGLVWRAAPLLTQIAISLVVVAALVPLRYTMMLALFLAAYALATQIGARCFRQAASDANDAIGMQTAALGDILRNARRVVFNGNIAAELEAIGDRLDDRRRANERVMRLIAATAGLQFLAVGSVLTALLVLGALDVAGGRITVGDFVLLQAYAFRLALPLGGFGYIIRQAGVSIANIREAFDLIDEPGAPRRPPSPAPIGPASITLDNVGFRYGDDWVLRGASAQIEPGAFVVLIGPNGSGKSTLVQIIAGIIEPNEGAVSINGRSVSEIDPEERHRLVLYTPQSIGLFNRSLRENALYPPTRASEAELASILADWSFYESGRPIDLDLAVGEQGVRLSGGQMQKLELARLAGVRAPVIILDESTSALDFESEARAIRALRERYRGRSTLILITHRVAMACEADVVLFLDSGNLTAGQHGTLPRECPAYEIFCGMGF